MALVSPCLLFYCLLQSGLNVAVVGVPKTIDNDIGVIDYSFGFRSAVQAAQASLLSAEVGWVPCAVVVQASERSKRTAEAVRRSSHVGTPGQQHLPFLLTLGAPLEARS